MAFKDVLPVLLLSLLASVNAFIAPVSRAGRGLTTMKASNHVEDLVTQVKKAAVPVALGVSFLLPFGTFSPPPAVANPYDSICMGFGCGGFRGLKYDGAAAPLDEKSIPWGDFLKELDSNKVVKVEFSGPDGDKAYAWLEGADEPIRIGEGFPAEQHDGYSSPLWAVRALQNKKVPYKFTYDLSAVKKMPQTVQK